MNGANASAVNYSIVETAKDNGLSPCNYVTYVFEQLPLIDINDEAAIGRLFP